MYIVVLLFLLICVACSPFRDGNGNIGDGNAPSGCYIIKEPGKKTVERCYHE